MLGDLLIWCEAALVWLALFYALRFVCRSDGPLWRKSVGAAIDEFVLADLLYGCATWCDFASLDATQATVHRFAVFSLAYHCVIVGARLHQHVVEQGGEAADLFKADRNFSVYAGGTAVSVGIHLLLWFLCFGADNVEDQVWRTYVARSSILNAQILTAPAAWCMYRLVKRNSDAFSAFPFAVLSLASGVKALGKISATHFRIHTLSTLEVLGDQRPAPAGVSELLCAAALLNTGVAWWFCFPRIVKCCEDAQILFKTKCAREEEERDTGSGYYQLVNGHRLDRALLEEARDLVTRRHPVIRQQDVRRLWLDAHDGPGVTDTELRTFDYIHQTIPTSAPAAGYLLGVMETHSGHAARGEKRKMTDFAVPPPESESPKRKKRRRRR